MSHTHTYIIYIYIPVLLSWWDKIPISMPLYIYIFFSSEFGRNIIVQLQPHKGSPDFKHPWRPVQLTPATLMNCYTAASAQSSMTRTLTWPSFCPVITPSAQTASTNWIGNRSTPTASSAPTAVPQHLSHEMEWRDYKPTFILQVSRRFPTAVNLNHQ